jgi:L-lactate utilization protein LutC
MSRQAPEKERLKSSDEARSEILERLATMFDRRATRFRSSLAPPPDGEAGEIGLYRSKLDPADPQRMLDHLLTRFESNQIGRHLLAGTGELLDSLANSVFAEKARTVAVQAGPLFAGFKLVEELAARLPSVRFLVSGRAPAAALAAAEVGITACEALLAETGTLVISGRSAQELAASLLPEVHLCVGRIRDVRTDLSAWVAAGGMDQDLHRVFISGPSRTADIEKQVVIGVHGPRRVSVFLVREAA